MPQCDAGYGQERGFMFPSGPAIKEEKVSFALKRGI
jgi:hypothetical protein